MSAPVEKKKGVLAAFAPFPKPFWVINGVELFERGAYYGMLAVLSVFLVQDLGLPPALTGLLLAIQFPLLYFLPVFAGALADKLGFKKLLIATFAFLIAGYLVLSVATTFWIGLLGVALYGIGAGLFKPMPAATVSDTTSESDRNFGFAIYYWMINLGAFLAPLAMQQLFGGSYRQYFVVSAALSVLNLVICLTMWKDVRQPKPEVKVGQSMRGIAEIFQHKTFLVLLAIYCGFWFMYAITTSFLQTYAVEYGIMDRATVALIVPANALAILIVGPILSKLTGKLPSLPLMIAGITVFCAGFLLIGFVPTLIALLAGIFIYSIGEFLTHPSYLSYVTKISPPEKVPVFLGYGFIPIGIGQLLGTLSGGVLYGAFARGTNANPQMFWVAIVSVGMLTVAALLVYNYFLQPRPRDTIAPGPGEPKRRRGVGGMVGTFGLAIAAILMVPALLTAATLAPDGAPLQAAGTDNDALSTADLRTVQLPAIEGEAGEGQTVVETVTLPETARGTATFTLTWQDEPAGTPTGQNAPDEFELHVTLPDGTRLSSAPATNGKIELPVENARPGDYRVEIVLKNAGDVTAIGNPLGLPIGAQADNGNA
ncbi:MAG TPA: MFS transporter, partial [Candidatus Thermoplasmatota archaeon]|nr:MFS transporter [Candidatus Thermoplasmatota archaeon]